MDGQPAVHVISSVLLVCVMNGLALKLKNLGLSSNNITDEGVASLLAQPTAGKLKSLESLYLDYNQITDAGCAALASALRGGKLPALKVLNLSENPASEEAQSAVYASRVGLDIS